MTKSRQKIEMILEEVERLEKLVRNVGDFTKEYKLVKRVADINGVIRDVLKLMGESPFSEKYTFSQTLAEDLKETPCDPDRLRQVFMNILSNAMQAMENGGAVSISTERRSESIVIRITDQGIGMSEDQLLHIFEPFYTTRQKGSGLGLAISYKIIQCTRRRPIGRERPWPGDLLCHHPAVRVIPGQRPWDFLFDSKARSYYYYKVDAGWSSQVARRAHNPKAAGSNPAPATKRKSRASDFTLKPFFCFCLPLFRQTSSFEVVHFESIGVRVTGRPCF